MSDPNASRPPWQQCADDVAACAVTLTRLCLPDAATLRLLHQSMLRAQAELLKGWLTVIETKLGQTEPGPGTAGEKIPVD